MIEHIFGWLNRILDELALMGLSVCLLWLGFYGITSILSRTIK